MRYMNYVSRETRHERQFFSCENSIRFVVLAQMCGASILLLVTFAVAWRVFSSEHHDDFGEQFPPNRAFTVIVISKVDSTKVKSNERVVSQSRV